jgi:hypothetical protein
MKIIRSVGLMLSSRLGSLVADGAEALTAGIYGGHAGAELPPGMAGTWLGATVTLPLQGQKQRDHERTLLLLRQRPKIAAETAMSTRENDTDDTKPGRKQTSKHTTPLASPRGMYAVHRTCTCTGYKEIGVCVAPLVWPPVTRSLSATQRNRQTATQCSDADRHKRSVPISSAPAPSHATLAFLLGRLSYVLPPPNIHFTNRVT